MIRRQRQGTGRPGIAWWLLLAWCLWLPALADGTAQGLLRGFFDGLTDYAAVFDQRLYDETGHLLETSHGRMRIERPDRFRWDYQKPYRQLVLSDGRYLWTYDPDLAQATRRPLAAAIRGTPAELLAARDGLQRLLARFRVTLGERPGEVVLTPRGPDGSFQRVRLGFSGRMLTRMVLVDRLGQRTELLFHDPVRNGTPPPGAFDIQLPPDVDLIDGDA